MYLKITIIIFALSRMTIQDNQMVIMKNKNAIAALYDSHEQAEKAVKILHKSGYGTKQFSILGNYYRPYENVVGYYKIEDRIKKRGSIGSFLVSMRRLLFGSAFL